MVKLLEVTSGLIALRKADGALTFSSANPMPAKLGSLSVSDLQIVWPEPDHTCVGGATQKTNDFNRAVVSKDVVLGSAPNEVMDMIWGRLRVDSIDTRGSTVIRQHENTVPIGIWMPLIGSTITGFGFDAPFDGGPIILVMKTDLVQSGGNFNLRLTTATSDADVPGPNLSEPYQCPDLKTAMTVDVEISWGKFVTGE